MAFTLATVVPWGRSYDEYVAMFALGSDDLSRRILGCGDGPAAFNSVVSRRGGRVVSVDPIYEFSAEQLAERIAAVFAPMLAETERNQNEFVWRHVRSTAELGRLRRQAMDEFLSDYAVGCEEQRYIAAELPVLPFVAGSFELALCSHFLFLYSEHFSLQFHVDSLAELCRVASEVRVFPLNELGARPSRHLEAVIAALMERGMRTEIVRVDYEFQKGADRMLRIVKE